ncbi:MAG: exo-alpha-sialidase [Acidobacteria bacterium]|nr:MAG: exo-alpha-sialidase [Acidobacteriota bacterium]
MTLRSAKALWQKWMIFRLPPWGSLMILMALGLIVAGGDSPWAAGVVPTAGWSTGVEEEALAGLPPLVVVALRYTDGGDHFFVEAAGVTHGTVWHPGNDPHHRYAYEVLSPSGDVLWRGTFDLPIDHFRQPEQPSATPDDVIHIPAQQRLLLRIPYRPEIGSLRLLDRRPSGERDGADGTWAMNDREAGRWQTILLDAADLAPIDEAVWLSGGVVFRPGRGVQPRPLAWSAAVDRRVEFNFRANGDRPRRAAQNEPFIAINPLDPDNLVAGANEGGLGSARVAFYRSTDGGRTWRAGQIRQPQGFVNGSDPGLTADAHGHFFYSFIAFTPRRTGVPIGGVFVAQSTNGGRTFRRPVAVIEHLNESDPDFEDKSFIAADANPLSPFANNLYVSWTSFLSRGGVEIKFARSTDDGRSFEAPLRIRRAGNQQFSLPVVGPDGEVYVIWQLGTTFRLARSTDGGQTFARDRRVASFIPIGTVDPDTGQRMLNGGFRVATYPAMAADTSPGPHRGNLYVVWSDGRYGDADILFTRSTDGGETWSFPPIRINDDEQGNGRDQFFPWVSVDPTNGTVVVMFYDRRSDPENLILDVFVTRSTDGGETFEPNFQVNTESFDPTDDFIFQGSFIGDYNGLVAFDDRAFPVWTDTRRGEQDIFGARINFAP